MVKPRALVVCALALVVQLASAACSAPRIVEDSAASCTNGLDDDRNGRVDCEDPSCIENGLCEATAEACNNGVDDDGNGAVDCEDATCIASGLCAARTAECSVDPPAGCPRGLICSADGDQTTGSSCALPGTRERHEECDGPGSCRPGLHCFGVCRKICQTQADCWRESLCVRNARTKFGTCTIPCIPSLMGSGCPGGSCLVGHSFEVRFDDIDLGGYCGTPVNWRGRVPEGGPCDDPASVTKLSGMCEPPLVCYRSPDGTPRCRSICGISQEGSIIVACASPDHRCAPAFPLDQRPTLPAQLLMGICAP